MGWLAPIRSSRWTARPVPSKMTEGAQSSGDRLSETAPWIAPIRGSVIWGSRFTKTRDSRLSHFAYMRRPDPKRPDCALLAEAHPFDRIHNVQQRGAVARAGSGRRKPYYRTIQELSTDFRLLIAVCSTSAAVSGGRLGNRLEVTGVPSFSSLPLKMGIPCTTLNSLTGL
jgi:hypothetical protein